ncbi:Protein MLP1-like protein [Erysiphe neolycopersici]|uniref:Protein MLP1-like protein n=1 Tax=Erysiphe neolycopersici TaxID=212602 RepID=A0A420HQ40_9PEZI|nr:Protein MLP1-like protein [Erysiphe neolycopersici]
MATMAIDVGHLSSYLALPQDTLGGFIESPNTELAVSILRIVLTKAREYDELAAEKLRVDIELENVVRNSETRVESLKDNLEKTQKIVEEVRTKLNDEEKTRSSLESELQDLKTSSATSISVIETLKTRISALESANRDTMAVIELKNTKNDELVRELQIKHQKCLELTQQISNLQQEVQTAKNLASSASFREGAIKQELELAKKNNEWLESELKTKSADAMKYRKEKGAQVAELQRQNEEISSSLEALKKTNIALRNRVDELQKIAEDSLSKIQQLQEDAAKIEYGYRQELDSSRRLADLQSQQTQTHRNRLFDVEASIEKIKLTAAEEAGRCRAEAESERKDREQAEERIAELESEVDRLETLIAQGRLTSRPGTPHQGFNGSLSGFSGSPSLTRTPGSVRNKSMITATQAIEELGMVRIELKKERLRSASLEAQIDQMVEGLEAKKPYVDELELENRRLEKEVVEISKYADQIEKERENAIKETRILKTESSTARAEAKILNQQLRDLSSQIKFLLAGQAARDQGLGDLNTTEKFQFESLAMGEYNEDNMDETSATDKLISQRLVLFKNISELQEKNQEQLKIIRQLGAQMESEEALAAKNKAAQDHEEVQRLQAKVESYKDELKSLIARSESYIKERDMFRRMLQHRGQLPNNSDLASIFGHSIQSQQNPFSNANEPNDNKSTDLALAIRNLQSQYDQYREEQTVDRKTLKEQVSKLSDEKSELQVQISKVKSQLTLATDRFDLLNSNYAMLSNENKELQKRTQILSEAAAKQDIRTQQVAEDLIEAKGLLESMRNENSNLKAEKNLWKDIQDRLSHDNESLMGERTRLNNLITNLQNLQNERELSETEIRRRLQSQIESLESELNSTKQKLSNEMEDNKKSQLRKEYDSQQNQKRIDDLASSLSHSREELIAVKTSRDHLQTRIEELTIELKSSEERVQLLQPRPTQRTNNNDHEDNDIAREQELLMEVSELKRDLDLAKSELENSKYQMEQFKSIAQSTEEEIESLNTTTDQFRDEMDRVIQEKDAKIRELELRVEDISAELTKTNDELTNLRNQQGEITRNFNDEKSSLQAEISRLKDEGERYLIAAQFHQQDLRAQAEIATKAQQDYENELVKHADAAKQLQSVRAELNQLKTESVSLKSDAESSRAALSQNEISWKERCENFEQELKDLRDRRDDLNAQNKILYKQLEDINSQVLSLQQNRVPDGDFMDESLSSSIQDRSANGLRELNVYLRREKEIIEVQYELKSQETKRLCQQLEYAQSQLDETRLKLDQERRSQADFGRNSVAHKDLMDKLNELNLFRESSTTLRNELRQAQSQLTEKTELVDELLGKIQPLKARICELEHRQETLEGEIILLKEDRDRWQKRTQDIISKYDRIDPADMEKLKETVKSLQSECDALHEDKKIMEEKLSDFQNEKIGWEKVKQKLIDQAKDRNRTLIKDIKDRTSERDSVIQERDAAIQERDTVTQERDAMIQEKEVMKQKVSNLQKELEILAQERDTDLQQLSILKHELEMVRLEKEKPTIALSQPLLSHDNTTPAAKTDPVVDEEVSKLRQELQKIMQEKQKLQDEVNSLREQLELANSLHEKITSRTPETSEREIIQESDKSTDVSSGEGQHEESNSDNQLTISKKMALEEQVKVAEAKVKEYEDRAKFMEEEMESKLKRRSDTMRTALNKKLAESKKTQKAELEAEYKLRFEQEKLIWLAESAAQTHSSDQTTENRNEIETKLPETPKMPTTSAHNQGIDNSLANISEDEARQLCQNNKTIREIIRGNIMSKVSAEIQKVKDEHAKILADVNQKADLNKSQAVSMEAKKSALKINMTENRIRVANGKLQIVEQAAQNTPERAVVEVWVEAKNYKPPSVASILASNNPPVGSSTSLNGNVSTPSKTSPKLPNTVEKNLPNSSTPPTASNITPVPSGNVKIASQSHSLPQRVSSIPMMRGGGNLRGRGVQQIYQPSRGGGSGGRGRGLNMNHGGLQRGGSNMGPNNSPGLSGSKRPRDDVSTSGHVENTGGKRPRGG